MAKYKVYCEDEGAYIHGTGTPQEVCPTNGAHTVTVGSLVTTRDPRKKAKVYPKSGNTVITGLTYAVHERLIIDYDYGRTNEGELQIRIVYVDRAASVKITNPAETTTYGELTGINSTGIHKIDLTNLPDTGTETLKILVKKDSAGGTDPTAKGLTLYQD